MPFYYLTAEKSCDVFHNTGPLALLRLKNTLERVLISVDLLKVTLLHIFFVYSYTGLIFGGLTYGITFVLIFWWTYIW